MSFLLNRIEKHLFQIFDSKQTCSVMLTGGRSAEVFYRQWSSSIRGYKSKIRFYFGDERCVLPSSNDSNFFAANKFLFDSRFDFESEQVFRIRGESEDVEAESDRYSSLLPDPIDVLFLSLGEDGHIASLFPNSSAIFEHKRKVVPVLGPKAPYRRITITPPVIQSAKHVYIFAIGKEKRCKYEEALLNPEDVKSIPARLVLDRTWIFDMDEKNNYA